MSPAEAVAARRRELRRAFMAIRSPDPGSGWVLLRLSAYTAHAVFRHGWAVAHVVGTASGWWWGPQQRAGYVGPMVRVDDVAAACQQARHDVYSRYQIEQQRRRREARQHGQQDGVRDVRGDRRRAA